ncbi:MAG: twin-arginine translocase subunit TatC, partial [Paracoccaceae bacterium]|nr:twin-arginine translocase subunit TatC [Paracoccaceae bacterium]
AFAYYAVLPLAFDFFLGFQQFNVAEAPAVVEGAVPLSKAPAGVLFQGSMEEYLALTINFILAFGLCFQLPVLLTLMGKAGLVSAKGLAGVRKYAVVGILVVAALVTPPDVLTQAMMFTVIYGLYEISIFLVRRIEKAREAKLRAEGLWVDDDEDEDEAEAEA